MNIGQSNIDSLFIIDLFRSAGGGTLFLLEVVPDNGLVEVACTQWSDGLFDVAWSETDANIIVSASGDGGLQLWNMSCPQVIDKGLSTGINWYELPTGNRQCELPAGSRHMASLQLISCLAHR